ncbi:DsbA family protein [Paracoccus sp. MBLB3053]|uniref:DsbA family protein n=1 Tax=Paracoccus aurantius TaxID=3073814 RepID=A0ABU2HNU8_9RHOB|nr:DsbA family protein [Paracoccus sp. MBLB3053]MDS9466299.1 DsbA family protein [Paracoccus sp. MBLB3053]
MTLSRRSLIAAASAALTAVVVSPALAQETQPAPAEEQMPEGRVLDDIVLGNADAPVTVIEYASFTCSHCQAFHEENLPKLKAEYIETGKVKFIQRDVYFDAVGLWAGILARCGGDTKYYAIADLLFDDQKTWLNAKTGDEIAANLRKVGAKAGMSAEQMDACWADKQMVSDLVATFQKHATDDKVEGTPTFIIAGEKVQNQPWEDLKKIIDAKIAEAENKG